MEMLGKNWENKREKKCGARNDWRDDAYNRQWTALICRVLAEDVNPPRGLDV